MDASDTHTSMLAVCCSCAAGVYITTMRRSAWLQCRGLLSPQLTEVRRANIAPWLVCRAQRCLINNYNLLCYTVLVTYTTNARKCTGQGYNLYDASQCRLSFSFVSFVFPVLSFNLFATETHNEILDSHRPSSTVCRYDIGLQSEQRLVLP